MKITLEDREYELKANGSFMKKYQDTFKENLMISLFKGMQEKDIYECSKVTYCAIGEETPFEEWLDSFDTPMFILPVMDKIYEYLVRSFTPTVDPKQTEQENLKKKTETEITV